MAATAPGRPQPILQIVGPTDGWILERLARKLAAKLPYAEFVPWQARPGPATRIAYYMNYALYERSSGLIDVAFFTHEDPTQQFLERAQRVDYCVCMSRLYADWLRDRGVVHVAHIPMGFDYYRYRPRLVLGVIGRLDHPRKGKHLVERLRTLPFVEVVTTEGRLADDQLRALYQRLDYVLIPATVEGGPLSLLEGLAMGTPVIAPAGVGLVPEFGATEHVVRYPAGEAEALMQVVTDCYRRKCEPLRLVQDRTWDRWAEAHHRLFVGLLQAHGRPLPEPAPGFRFGMLAELDIPQDVDVHPLETGLDGVAALLYHGDYGPARAALERLVPSYPFVGPLLATIPGASGEPLVTPSAAAKPHAKALR